MEFVSMIDYIEKQPTETLGFDEPIEEIEESEELEFSLDDVEFDYDNILNFSDDEDPELNSVNMSGVVQKIIFKETEDNNFLTIYISNSYKGYTSYVKLSFYNEFALQYKDFFEEKEYSFYDFQLTIKKNRKNGGLSPELVYKEESDVVEL